MPSLLSISSLLTWAQASAGGVADNMLYVQINNLIVRFTALFFEALPWVILGSIMAAIVHELPTRRAPAIMLPLGVALLVLTLVPASFYDDLGKRCSALIGGGSTEARIFRFALEGFVVAGITLLSGFLLLRVQGTTDRMLGYLGAHRGLAIFLSGLLGLIIPMCECGIIAVMRRLYRKGMPLSCCTAYVLAGPIINVVVLCTTYVAFSAKQPAGEMNGWWLMGLRGLMGFLVAVGTGYLVERQYRKYGSKLLTAEVLAGGSADPEADEAALAQVPWSRRFSNIAGTALHDIIDICFYLVIGALLAATVRQFLLDEQQFVAMATNQPMLAIAAMMGLGFLITLCSEADAFIAASFTTLGSAPKLAFMVFGPMLDLKLFLMYTRVFRPRLMMLIILATFAQVFLYSYFTHLAWTGLAR